MRWSSSGGFWDQGPIIRRSNTLVKHNYWSNIPVKHNYWSNILVKQRRARTLSARALGEGAEAARTLGEGAVALGERPCGQICWSKHWSNKLVKHTGQKCRYCSPPPRIASRRTQRGRRTKVQVKQTGQTNWSNTAPPRPPTPPPHNTHRHAWSASERERGAL